jgi:hypothetical protein
MIPFDQVAWRRSSHAYLGAISSPGKRMIILNKSLIYCCNNAVTKLFKNYFQAQILGIFMKNDITINGKLTIAASFDWVAFNE